MKKIIGITGLAAITLLVTSCDISQKKEAELPEIDVDVQTEAGQLPSFDVDWAEVNVGTRTKTVTIPKVVIVTEEEEIEVPYLDVDMPNTTADKEELNLVVEAEVTDNEHSIKIKEIIATDDKLFVISELKEGSTAIGDQKMRVSDQVVLNAPDLNVKHIIVGEKPDRVFNDQYKYVENLSSFKSDLEDATVIYSK
ncbi:hypothetical protein [uncultured Dokdonia sp.]|uniref:hypothetical protein n=1 Tax=uncultured Dokdonia sp. TaxID=575653 RepID=UPI0026354085|nr:hypothetical protein [uncultured Dokdonia sp.]